MATVFAKQFLSDSANGKGILISGTTSGSTTIHTATAGTTNIDEIWLYAFNSDSTAHTLTIEFGGTTNPNNDIAVSIASGSGLYCVVPGFILQNGLAITAYADAANKVVVYGFVNNLTVS